MASRAMVAAILAPRLEGAGRLVAGAVRQVEDLLRDEPGGAARRHVVEPGGHQRQRPVAREAQREPRVAEDLRDLGERGRGEAERLAFGRSLVGREVARLALGAPGAGVGAAQLGAADAQAAAVRSVRRGRLCVRRRAGGAAQHPVGVETHAARRQA